MRKSSASKTKLQSMPSISEQQQQQNIPDKFWSKMGRKLSTQNSQGLQPMTSRENIESWFHEDDGIVSPNEVIADQKGTYAPKVIPFFLILSSSLLSVSWLILLVLSLLLFTLSLLLTSWV